MEASWQRRRCQPESAHVAIALMAVTAEQPSAESVQRLREIEIVVQAVSSPTERIAPAQSARKCLQRGFNYCSC